MIEEFAIRKLIEEKLSGTGLFLTDLAVKQGNNIQVAIDGDQNVSIDDCIMLSRFIESNLNRENEDFNLEVSSAGVDQPLLSIRQYAKNIGRRMSISLANGSNISGKLLAADNEKIQLQTEIKKGRRILPGPVTELEYNEIVKAICLVSFK